MVIGDSGCELETTEMLGAATSNTLSANSASLFKSMVASVEAITIRTLVGGTAVCSAEFVTEKLLHMS